MKGFPLLKAKTVWSATVLCLLAGVFPCSRGSAFGQSATKRASGDLILSAPEKDLLAEINALRAHPDKYVTYLEGLKPFFKGKQYQPGKQRSFTTKEGWVAVEEAIAFLRSVKSPAPLSLSRGLCLAASTHVKDQAGNGATGHKGSDNSLIENRVKPFGAWDGAIGENLSYGNETARDRILTWLIDDGVASRGHRKRILSADYKVAGLACGPHPEYGVMCVLELAGGFKDSIRKSFH